MILVDRRGEDFPSTTNDNFTLGNFTMEELDFLLRHETEIPATMEKLDKEKYLSYFFPFDKIDFRKMGVESSWSTDSVEMIALIMTMKNKSQAVMMSFQKATSIDYDPRAESSILFFKQVQNKMHWAAHKHTAAEVIYQRADAKKDNMGLTSWANDTISPIEQDFIKSIGTLEGIADSGNK